MSPAEIAGWVLRGALALAFLVMGVSHFTPAVARTMRAMIPPVLRRPGLPSPTVLVALTGVCEIAGAAGIVVPWEVIGASWMRWVTGIALVAFLVAVFPANAYAAAHPERFGRAAFPYWPRFAGQLVLVLLVVLATAPL